MKINDKINTSGSGINKIGNLPRDIEYNQSTIFKNFSSNNSGFGFSNFRINDDVRKVQQNDEYIGPVIERDNPAESYDYKRNDNLFFKDRYNDYEMISKEPNETNNANNSNYIDIIKGFHEINPTMIAFFSKENIDHIQKIIISMIYKSEKIKISNQNEEQLLMIMRAKYMNATYLNCDLKGKEFHKQICSLNKDVIDEVIPRIIVGIKTYLGFVKDKSTNPHTIDRPEYINKSGENLRKGFSDFII